MKTRQQVLGQNFLHHQPTIKKIIDQVISALEHDKTIDTIIEVGPGKLALTEHLISFIKTEKPSIELHLVERDQKLVPDIEQELLDFKATSFTHLHVMDAASSKMSDLIKKLVAKKRQILFVSNLPYSAASQILAELCLCSIQIKSLIVMVQKEMAERICAEENTSDRGSFSIFIQSYFSPKMLFDVGPGAFTPPPKVMSTVIKLIPLPKPMIEAHEQKNFEIFCKKLFSQRRKMIRGTLKLTEKLNWSNFDLNGTERPENLSNTKLLQIFRALQG